MRHGSESNGFPGAGDPGVDTDGIGLGFGWVFGMLTAQGVVLRLDRNRSVFRVTVARMVRGFGFCYEML